LFTIILLQALLTNHNNLSTPLPKGCAAHEFRPEHTSLMYPSAISYMQLSQLFDPRVLSPSILT
jgi:hypothetical protein